MIINWPFAKTYRVRCPDGTVKTLHRNVDDAFPLFIPGWQGNVDAELKALEAIPARLRAKYETKIQGLLYRLDELNQSLMMNFRGAYV
ncbi:MAG TPA: hypothetical protein VLE27_04695, partial [Thermoanaerobaculia bacterium]|nr:hypothetical protein [Thermoanaerobaculia bacterium]